MEGWRFYAAMLICLLMLMIYYAAAILAIAAIAVMLMFRLISRHTHITLFRYTMPHMAALLA